MKIVLTIAFAASGLAAQPVDVIRGVESLGPGIYYRSADSTWTKMEPITSRGFQSRAGFMSAKAVTVYSGSSSAVHLIDRRPTFYIKEPIPTMRMNVTSQAVSSSTTMVGAPEGQGEASAGSRTLTRGESSSTYSLATQPGDARSLVVVRLAIKKKQRELPYAGGSVFNFHTHAVESISGPAPSATPQNRRKPAGLLCQSL
jgi:hypothetical protein